ncbi:MAG: LuxR C-terminal-related transcriptional regulator [Anaerolineales bacterium]
MCITGDAPERLPPLPAAVEEAAYRIAQEAMNNVVRHARARRSSVFSAMRAGARGYLLKGAKHAEMLRAIHAVSNGEAIFSQAIAVRLMEFFGSMRPAAPPRVFPELSDREREILGLIAQGYKNAEIAERLVLSAKTVRNHVTNILSKLQVADRAQAIIRAREAGLG